MFPNSTEWMLFYLPFTCPAFVCRRKSDRKTINIEIDYPLTVQGVFEDIPENTEFHFDGVYSFDTRSKQYGSERGGWGYDSSYHCMVRFRHPNEREKVEVRMPEMLKSIYTTIRVNQRSIRL